MRKTVLTTVATLGALAAVALAVPTATLTLTSPQDGQTVAPGTQVDWTAAVEVSTGDNDGLALVACDLEQDAANPEKLDLQPGDTASIPAAMQKFDRPLGIANPGEGGEPSGYIGVQRGTAGELNLKQLGGAQNTFGVPGSVIGTDATVVEGIGQGGAQTIVTGSFVAPSTPGTYTFRLTNGIANVLTVQAGTPAPWPVEAADVVAGAGAEITLTVGAAYPTGDMNCDGTVDVFDINPFVEAILDPAAYAANYPNCDIQLGDINGDTNVDVFDINPFVDLILSP